MWANQVFLDQDKPYVSTLQPIHQILGENYSYPNHVAKMFNWKITLAEILLKFFAEDSFKWVSLVLNLPHVPSK